ncbi:MAG: mechanosensitive ion channel family protein [Bacteroidales bacterium]|jgi:MscS family membrane protein|nr:mechanosensitive ion channel family protein [Bacteroidales bacterium]
MLEQVFFGNSIKAWAISLAIIAGAILLNKCIVLFNRRVIKKATAKSSGHLDNLLFESLEKPLVLGIMLVAIWVVVHRLNMEPTIRDTIEKAYQMLTVVNVTWFFSKFLGGLMDEYGHRTFNARFLPLLKRGIVIAVWIVGLVTALNNIGVKVTTLLGALGLGGMAIALAAQDSIKNIFGSITIFTDAPFRLGDIIKFDGFEGVVLDIGIRSTRIQTYENRMVTIPNYKLMDAVVINISREPSRKVTVKLGLTYDTSPQKMQEAIELLKDIPQAVLDIENTVTAYFSDFGDFAMVITCHYFIKKGRDIFETTSRVNFEILRRFNDAGLNFAFPSQTVYLEKTSNLPC